MKFLFIILEIIFVSITAFNFMKVRRSYDRYVLRDMIKYYSYGCVSAMITIAIFILFYFI